MHLNESWKPLEDQEGKVQRAYRRVERLTGLNHDQLCMLAIHRVITPALVATIAQRDLALESKDSAAAYVTEKVTKEELPFTVIQHIVPEGRFRRRAYDQMVVFKNPEVDPEIHKARGIYLLLMKWLEQTDLAKKQDFTFATRDYVPVTRLWGWHQLTGRDLEMIPRTIALHPHAREYVLRDVPRERLIGLHANALLLYDYLGFEDWFSRNLYSKIKYDATSIVEKAYHFYCMQMLLNGVDVSNLYRGQVEPPDEIKAETYAFVRQMVSQRTGDQALVSTLLNSQLSFNFIDHSLHPGDPDIQFIDTMMENEGVLFGRPHPTRERQIVGKSNLPEIPNLYVQGGIDVISCSLRDEDILEAFIHQLYREDQTKIAKGVVLLSDGRPTQFRTSHGLNIQLRNHEYERDPIAVIEDNKGKVSIFRTRGIRISETRRIYDWHPIGTLEIAVEREEQSESNQLGTKVKVTYVPEPRQKVYITNDAMTVHKGGQYGQQETEASILIGSEDEGNIVISSGRYYPVHANPYNARKRKSRLELYDPWVQEASVL